MRRRVRSAPYLLAIVELVWISPLSVFGQAPLKDPSGPQQLKLNWIYGAYIPKDEPLAALTTSERRSLYLRQTFTTSGIYVKTALFSMADQISNSPPEWKRGMAGYVQRLASRQGEFIIQNSIASLGNGLLGYEPRYDRCRCSGFWPRAGHAVLRNFVTYNHANNGIRPQFATFGAAWAAGAISGEWKPRSDAWADGYRGALTQAGFGVLSDSLGEFAPDIVHALHRLRSGHPQR